MKWISFVLFFCFYIHAENLGIAPLDPDHESKFYSIYKTYHSQQMSVNEWQELIRQKSVNIYTMQKGDNLWDISRMLFDNSNHWPKLWSVNADLSNPHRVSIGYELQVIMGSEGQVPRAVINGQAVTKTKDVSPPSVGGSTVLQNGSAPSSSVVTAEYSTENSCVTDLGIILNIQGSTSVYDSEVKCRAMKKKLRERKVKDTDQLKNFLLSQEEEDEDTGLQPFIAPGRLGVIPDSLPPIKLAPEQGIDIIGLGRNLSTSHKNVVVNYQVDRNDIDIVGNIFDVLDGIPVPTSEIVVELDVPASSGDIFSVISPMRKVRSRSLFISGPFGYEVIFQAQVRVTSPVPNREGLYFVKVIKMYNEISEDSKLIRETPSVFDFQSDIRSGQNRAQITSIPNDQSSLALTVHSFIYLNKGSNNNVNVGDVFNIQANPRFHDRAFGKALGRVVIVHTAGDFSTGFVTHLKDVSYPGDYLDPLDQAGYVPDSEADDVYEADERDNTYEDDEEEDFATDDDVYEADEVMNEASEEETGTFSQESEDTFDEIDGNLEEIEEPILEDVQEFDESESILEGTEEEGNVSNESTLQEDGDVELFPVESEEEALSSDEDQTEESFLDDYEDEELEWGEE